MTALFNHNDLFRYGPESEAQTVSPGLKQVLLAADQDMVQSKRWFKKGVSTRADVNQRVAVSYVLDGFFEIEVDGKSQILGPSGSFLVPPGVSHSITCLEDGILLGAFSGTSSASIRPRNEVTASSNQTIGRAHKSGTTVSTQFD